MGMAIGEERTFELPFPDDHEDEDKQGKQAKIYGQTQQHQREENAGT